MSNATRLLATAIFATSLSATAPAMAYPDGPVKVIVPNGAGGSTDIVSRIVSRTLAEQINSKLAIVNMPGGGTSIGAQEVAKAKPDGYTLLSTHEALLTSSAMGANKLGPASLKPIAQVAKEVVVLAVPADSPINSLEDFYKAASKGHDGKKLKLGVNPGAANHFFMLTALSPVEHDVTFLPTGGGAKTLKSLLGSHIDAGAFAVSESIEAIRGGKAKPIALFDKVRHADLPDTPTAKELGHDLSIGLHYVWYAPAGTPDDIVKVLADGMAASVADKALATTLTEKSITPALLTGAELVSALDGRYAATKALADKYIHGK